MNKLLPIICFTTLMGCKNIATTTDENQVENNNNRPFPSEMVDFDAYNENPVFTGSDSTQWDTRIRERGYIIRENGTYFMWYTGYRHGDASDTLKLGFATSPDGISWTRYEGNPIFGRTWTEDMMVIKADGIYYMFAEGRNDIAHMLSSKDKVTWKDHGPLDIRQMNGDPAIEGPYGTPTVWCENGLWYLFYERNDKGIWLSTSEDLNIWTNLQDDPVIKLGPESYDKFGLAVNQVIKYKNRYYAYYHGTAFEDWHEWSTNVASSEDLIHWEKYKGNPIMEENKSSGILVYDGEQYRLYTMHNKVAVHFHKAP